MTGSRAGGSGVEDAGIFSGKVACRKLNMRRRGIADISSKEC